MERRPIDPKNPSNDPEDYKQTPVGNFNINADIEDIYKYFDTIIKPDEWEQCIETISECVAKEVQTYREVDKIVNIMRRKYKHQPKKSQLLYCLNSMVDEGKIKPQPKLNSLLIKKKGKSLSGVLVITVLTSPYPKYGDNKVQKFSCEWNCYYCPNEPGQPRSYLHDEPAVLRANRNSFDAVLQFVDRAVTLSVNGHPLDKIELLILGGTWASYPHEYQEEFIRDLFYAANTFFTRYNKREKKSLQEEKKLNEYATCKIIGITLETRPDCINDEELIRFRKYGCTRIQLGVQHTSDEILRTINRGCYSVDVRRALRLLKDNCYKIDIHLMPNLPGSTPQIDKEMFEEVLYDADYQADQWKIYPTETTPWTVIQKWHASGQYVPYEEEQLLQVIMDTKVQVHPWIRLNRVIRDIPSQYVLGGVDNPSMRQFIEKKLKEQGKRCRCIRCREVKDADKAAVSMMVIRSYRASGGLEFFISYETEDKSTICGFARLRIPKYILDTVPSEKIQRIMRQHGVEECTRVVQKHYPEETDEVPGHASPDAADGGGGGGLRERQKNKSRSRSKSPFRSIPSKQREDVYTGPFPELQGAGLVRELHVYGKLRATMDKYNKKLSGAHEETQHIGLGSLLMYKCEEIGYQFGCKSLAVIAGVGVRNFYRKIGYEISSTKGEMMMKKLSARTQQLNLLNHSFLLVLYQNMYVLLVVLFIAALCFFSSQHVLA